MDRSISPARPADIGSDAAARLARVTAVLLDFDGTVVDTIELITESFRHTISTVLGQHLPDEVLIQNVGMPLREQMRIFSPEKEEELVRVYREHNHSHHDEMIKEFPGAKEALRELRAAGFKLAVVTSKSRSLAERGMDAFDFRPLFDAGVYAEDTASHKPSPEPVWEACSRLQVTAGQAVFVGDSPHDVTAGRTAGVLTIAALWGPFPRARMLEAGPDVILEAVDELAPLLVGARSVR